VRVFEHLVVGLLGGLPPTRFLLPLRLLLLHFAALKRLLYPKHARPLQEGRDGSSMAPLRLLARPELEVLLLADATSLRRRRRRRRQRKRRRRRGRLRADVRRIHRRRQAQIHLSRRLLQWNGPTAEEVLPFFALLERSEIARPSCVSVWRRREKFVDV
jgi:hypothetical protein